MSYEDKNQEFIDRVKEIQCLSDIEELKKIAKGNRDLETVYATFRLIELSGPFKLPDFESLIISPDQPLFSELSQDKLYDAFLSYMELEKESKFGHPTPNFNIIFDDIEIPIDLVIVYYLTDQLHLKNVVLKVYNMFTQLAALTKITSQTVLGELFIKRVNIPQVKDALRLVYNELILAKIAIKRKNFAIGYYCEPDYEHHCEWNYGVRADAVQRINDQNILKEIFANASYHDVKLLALEKISDIKILGELAKQLFDQDVIAKLIHEIGDNYWADWSKSNTIAVLKDQEILAAIAICYKEEGEYQSVSEKAAQNITDQSLLKKVLKLSRANGNKWAWEIALDRITDINYLKKIVPDYDYGLGREELEQKIAVLQQHA